jgi:P4 family phage/plasmid primase-like protien
MSENVIPLRTEADTVAGLQATARAQGADSRAAEIIADHVVRGRFRWTPALGWLQWDGCRWSIDEAAEAALIEAVRQFADDTERDYRARAGSAQLRESALIDTVRARAGLDPLAVLDRKEVERLIENKGTPDERKTWQQITRDLTEARTQADIWLNLLNVKKLQAVVTLCRGMDGVRTRTTDLDAHPDLLNVRNGVVDLRTGELRPSDPDLLMTRVAGVDYIPSMRAPRWTKALEAVHPGCLEWFQLKIGQSATGYTPTDDTMVISHGGGENGKTAVMTAIRRALGDYARTISHRVLIAQPGQHPTELMDLRGCRLALLEETPEEGRLDTHRIKETVGTPEIEARRMRRDPVTFTTSHTLWVNTNFRPQVDSTDHGTWRRLQEMPWPFTFVKPGRPLTTDAHRAGDPRLKPACERDPRIWQAALSWIVEGAVAWFAGGEVGSDAPAPVVEATAEWRSSTDVGFQFAAEQLVADPAAFITAEVMRREFSAFLAAQGKRDWSAQTLNTRLPASLAAAGIVVSAVPTKPAKIRQGDTESRPAGRDEHWIEADYPAPVGNAPGKLQRIWRGVRFKTATEAASHLRLV